MMNLRAALRFQNSYRLGPKNPFNRTEVEIILKKVMDKQFKILIEAERFETKTSTLLCQSVSAEIVELVKEKKFDRYKIIVIVTAVEKFMQGIDYSAKHLWDPEKDTTVTYTFDGLFFTAIGVCYAVYKD